MPLARITRNALCSVLVLLQVTAFPAMTLAQEAAPEAPSTTVVSEPTPAPPTDTTTQSGESTAPQSNSETPAATTAAPTPPQYTQNTDGTWSNGTYTWSPETRQSSPNTPQDYSYNPATGRWDTTQYIYSPETGTYIPHVVSVASNPGAAMSAAGPQSANSLGGVSPSGARITNTGPNSNNTIGGTSNTNGTFDLFFNGAISNNISSNATSGNSLVQGNTNAGSALTGDATAVANVLNLLQSAWLGQNPDNIASFISNIDGNVYGDLLIDPSQLPQTLGSNNRDIDVNVDNNGVINNNIDLTAISGDATVDSNTRAGDATTGNARAIANVFNLINSAINAGQSFFGTININGNLDGDILLPPGVLDALIANTGPNSNNSIGGGTTNSDVDLASTTNRTINNNVASTADTGDATTSQNTNAGSATTGSGQTTTNSLNLVGQNIKAKNGILVFVNVMGKWVGMVVGPANATIDTTGPNSNNTIGGDNSNQSLSVASNENSLINNNIRVNAQSGDATVSNNTNAGNARSGDAATTVNLINIIDGDIDVSDWFGVLFINVFGSWMGNFGADSAHGGFSQTPSSNTPSSGGATTAETTSSNTSVPKQVFGFIPATNNQSSRNSNVAAVAGDQPVSPDESNQNQAVIGSTTAPSDKNGSTGTSGVSTVKTQFNWWVTAGFIAIIATVIVLAREYVMALRSERLAS